MQLPAARPGAAFFIKIQSGSSGLMAVSVCHQRRFDLRLRYSVEASEPILTAAGSKPGPREIFPEIEARLKTASRTYSRTQLLRISGCAALYSSAQYDLWGKSISQWTPADRLAKGSAAYRCSWRAPGSPPDRLLAARYVQPVWRYPQT